MNNISGNPESWLPKEEVKKAEETVEEIVEEIKESISKPPLDLTTEASKVRTVINRLELKYKDYPNKHLYDSIISLYLAHNSLISNIWPTKLD